MKRLHGETCLVFQICCEHFQTNSEFYLIKCENIFKIQIKLDIHNRQEGWKSFVTFAWNTALISHEMEFGPKVSKFEESFVPITHSRQSWWLLKTFLLSSSFIENPRPQNFIMSYSCNCLKLSLACTKSTEVMKNCEILIFNLYIQVKTKWFEEFHFTFGLVD